MKRVAMRIERVKECDGNGERIRFSLFGRENFAVGGLIFVHGRFQLRPVGSFRAKTRISQHSIAEENANQLGMNSGRDDVILELKEPGSAAGAAVPEQGNASSFEQPSEKVRIDAIVDDGIAQNDNIRLLGPKPRDRTLVEASAERNELADQRRESQEASDENEKPDRFAMLAGSCCSFGKPVV